MTIGGERVVRWAHKTGVILVGFGAAFAAGVAGVFLAFVFGYSCGGSEGSGARTRRRAGSARSGGRTSSRTAAGGSSIGAPLLGMIWALNVERWWPVWVGCLVAVLDLLFLYSLLGEI